jgi:hypothetical protein
MCATSFRDTVFVCRVPCGRWSKSRRVAPSVPRLRRPAKEGPLARPFVYCPSGRVGLRTGIFDSPSMAQRKWPAVLAGPASRPCPFESLACGYRHRGGYPPALPQTEVACWASSAWGERVAVGVRRQHFVGCSRTSCAPTPKVGSVYSTSDPPAVCRSARVCANPQHHPRRLMPCASGKRAFPTTKRNLALSFSHTQPQSVKEPAGATLVAGSRRRGLRTDKARRGPARTAGHSC